MAQLLSNLPIGTKIKFGKYSVNGEAAEPIVWRVVAKNHSGYPSDAITLLTDQVIDLRAFDAKENSNPAYESKTYGNTVYSLSNIDQWLNKDIPNWYVPSHAYDQSPDSPSVCGDMPTHYATRPGFLNAFDSIEKTALLDTTIVSVKFNSDYSSITEYLTRKVFLPSYTEVSGELNGNVHEGEMWSYFESGGSKVCTATQQAQSNTLLTSANFARNYPYWLRTSNSFSRSTILNETGESTVNSPLAGGVGVRPALNISSSLKVSDITDSEGHYTIIYNIAPLSPAMLDIPTIYGGRTNAILWSSVTDPDGDTITYQLECSVNGGAYAQIYNGSAANYAHLVPFGTTSVTYRVKATDSHGESSAYTTSTTKNVINNNAPVISGTDGNLGVKSIGFTGTYTVTDANNNAVTVTEAIDGVQIRSLVATLGQAITYGITENTWLALPNGSHTLTISATDGIDSAVRTYVFTKLVDEFKIRNATPWVSTSMPSRIMIVVTRNIPSVATFKVEVCNNGYDTTPTWEDCTDAVTSGLVHVFNNKSKSATNWGVLVRVTVNRNGATGACYVSAIGGNFE